MRPLISTVLGLLALAWAGSAVARQTPSETSTPDYGRPESWLCSAGDQSRCTEGLDAMVVTPDGTRRPETFTPAADPKIDCFYVYPTVSREPADYADMTASPEVVETLKGQAARLTATCRLFAPVYRQLTLAGLNRALGASQGGRLDWDRPYQDVRAAWRWYLANENHGRGVVIIGHSQGAILLQRLIAEEIDGRDAQRRLVGAYLAGDPELAVPDGAIVGGSFKSIPLCQWLDQTGCVYAWSTYLPDEVRQPFFGRDPGPGLKAVCVNPAAPTGGAGELDGYLRRPSMASAGDPPWIRVKDQLTATCTRDPGGDLLVANIRPGRYAGLLKAGLDRYAISPGWGLHRLDLSLTQANVAARVAAQAKAWR
jgi:hypothetical protein